MTTVGTVLQSIVSGKSIQTMERPAQDDEYGILKVSAVTWGEFRPQQNKAMPANYEPGECPRPMDGDILISRANTRELVGAPVLVRGDHPQLLLSDKILKLIPNSALVDRKYLVRALRFPAATAHFFKCAGGSSGSMTNITQGDIRSTPIPLPPLQEQRRIAAILDQAETLRTQRRQALAHLDTLTQSLFLDMFGDPARNTLGLPMRALGDLGDWHSGGTPPRGSARYFQGDIPWFSSGELESMYVSDSSEHISEDAVRETSAKLVPAGALMLGMYDTAALKSSIAMNTCSCNQAIAFAVMRPDRALTEYVYFAVQVGREDFRRLQRGVRQKNLNLSMVREIRIPAPPLALQQTFATRIAAIEALKTTHRSALAQLDDLFASLQQRAFAGEL